MSLRSFTAVGTKVTFHSRSESTPDVEENNIAAIHLQLCVYCTIPGISASSEGLQFLTVWVCVECGVHIYTLGSSGRRLLQRENEWKNQVRPRSD